MPFQHQSLARKPGGFYTIVNRPDVLPLEMFDPLAQLVGAIHERSMVLQALPSALVAAVLSAARLIRQAGPHSTLHERRSSGADIEAISRIH